LGFGVWGLREIKSEKEAEREIEREGGGERAV